MSAYADDPPEMTLHRLRQANLVAGRTRLRWRMARRSRSPHPPRAHLDRTTVIELGGAGLFPDRDYRVTDVPLRGLLVVLRTSFWHRTRRRGAMRADRAAGLRSARRIRRLIDAARFDEWLASSPKKCGYQILPRENLIAGCRRSDLCDSRAKLEDRVRAPPQANSTTSTPIGIL